MNGLISPKGPIGGGGEMAIHGHHKRKKKTPRPKAETLSRRSLASRVKATAGMGKKRGRCGNEVPGRRQLKRGARGWGGQEAVFWKEQKDGGERGT